ncbi:hypothetical protein C3B58_09275 [Lactonifactor longoviformis]|uniref:Uncharacterized protein n=1 Tax=Lactonifactor longoviformis DSM 17459 TaxID=1122155 RepID=A0A1M5DAA1_9CLOT|nr:hypothetical protein [Lactonifactor longoviformis]POP33051.1 hypothetical protein C3B58_09275 [Lactonifactor longoviformis]SHF63874.1 hypothetical protein SAMN02745158_04471 [Lactonifactor longoviformis DSM 17459]
MPDDIIKSSPPFKTGNKVIAGTYCCMNCNNDGNNDDTFIHFVANNGGALPRCPKCGNTTWMKI